MAGQRFPFRHEDEILPMIKIRGLNTVRRNAQDAPGAPLNCARLDRLDQTSGDSSASAPAMIPHRNQVVFQRRAEWLLQWNTLALSL